MAQSESHAEGAVSAGEGEGEGECSPGSIYNICHSLRLRQKCRGCPVPALAVFRPDRYFGSIPERLDSDLAAFLQSGPDLLSQQDR